MTPLLKSFLNLSTAELFLIVGIPVVLFFIGIVAKGIAYSPRIQARELSDRDCLHMGIELCVMALGFYWRAAYSMPLLTQPHAVFAMILSLLLLLVCVLVRVRFHQRPWWDFVTSNLVGAVSVALILFIILEAEIKTP